MGIPIVFIHDSLEIPPHMHAVLLQARLTNPESPVFCITDCPNPPSCGQSDIDRSIAYAPYAQFSTAAKEFGKSVFNLSVNPGWFERLCFERWFVLRDFMRHIGGGPVFTLDADVLLFDNITRAQQDYQHYDFTIASHYNMCSVFINTPAVLDTYCEMLTHVFKRTNHYWGVVADYLNLTKPDTPVGNLSDMTTTRLLCEHGGFRWQDTASPLNGAMFDPNIALGDGAFTMENGTKKIHWIDRHPHVHALASGDFIRLRSMHFQGAAKPLIQGYFSEFMRLWTGATIDSGVVPQPPQPKAEPLRTHIVVDDLPLVSIVVPSYKKAAFLPEAVESIIQQDYPHIETLIVTDGSPDNTAEVAQALIRKYPEHRIQYLDKPHSGVSDTRNHGIRNARGTYVATMDGDDKIARSYVSLALAQMKRERANLFFCDMEIFGMQPGEWVPNHYTPLGIRYDNCFPIMSLFERSLWEKSGGYKRCLGFAEDWDFWLGLSRHGLRPTRSHDKLFLYRSHDSGISAQYINNSYGDCLSVVCTNNDDLYPVEEVVQSHRLLSAIKERTIERSRELDRMHPNEWFLKMWWGILAEARGDLAEARVQYLRAIELTAGEKWQPLFRLASLLITLRDTTNVKNLLMQAEVLRPDTRRVSDELRRLLDGGVEARA